MASLSRSEVFGGIMYILVELVVRTTETVRGVHGYRRTVRV